MDFFSHATFNKLISDFIESFLILVLSVPEGLPLVIVLTLANAAHQLYTKHKVAVKDLESIQAMGGIDLMCFDKTVNKIYILN